LLRSTIFTPAQHQAIAAWIAHAKTPEAIQPDAGRRSGAA
jgi:hypothetical protein